MSGSLIQPELLFQHAATLHDQGRVDLAIDQLRRLLALDPDHANAHALFCMCECKRKNLKEAERRAKEALRLDPDSAFVHYAYSILLSRQKGPKASEKALSVAIRLQPECSTYFYRLAAIKIDQRCHREALAAAERGLQLDPEHAGCASLRALTLARLRRWGEAREAIDLALSLNPESDYVHAAAGWKLMSQGRRTAAANHFREALRINAENSWALAGLQTVRRFRLRPRLVVLLLMTAEGLLFFAFGLHKAAFLLCRLTGLCGLIIAVDHLREWLPSSLFERRAKKNRSNPIGEKGTS